MQNRIDILNELKEISPILAGMEKINVFTVPVGYFDSLADTVLAIAKEEGTGILSRLSKENTTSVPAGYFDSLADNILIKVRAQQNETAAVELRALSPMLYSIQNINVFDVPNGYFSGLSTEIAGKVQPRRDKSIVTIMHKRRNTFIKYAVAAAFTGMMALGVFKFTKPNTPKLDATVLNGLQINKEHSFDQEFAKVSDEDIIKYLEANGENVDAQTVANNTVDENELPSQADYLSDDKALDKYLDNINLNDLKN